ncbi:gallate dioxygenase [Sphingobium yanoikuyae]|uniref:gallate dioxygenase n=1 Tax=Sphingobium yanoikuyae TaxID=13690 RepID=UPI0022DCFC0C|nr:gallate dioxygenase [Sphingobium yanoikuyae]WBQ15731.1 gallate dioxygenase [Sphingobium yanoikuyae]
MASIIGAIASSHTPTIGFALDAHKQDDPAWKPIFDAYGPIRQWLEAKQPDVLLMIYNDHITSFFFNHYSAFCLGVDDRYAVADEGGGPRPMPPVAGDAALSRHILQSLMTEEFDMSSFRDKPLDHGIFSPLSVLLPHDADGWPTRIVPLQVGVLQFPIPTARRCYRLGQALRRAIESYPEDIKVAIVATGGLSHQVHGERCGFNNTQWDMDFMDLLEKDPEALTRMTHADYARLGGMEGSEVIMWLIMRGALSATVRKVHGSYYLPSMTAIATAIYENEAAPMAATDAARHRDRMSEQLRGAEALAGTYPYTLERSARGWRVNQFLHRLVDAGHRSRFLADEAAELAAADLSDIERDLIRRRDWRGLIHHGAIFFLLEKLGAVSGISNLHIYAAMRGESLEAFQKTRNQQVLYSVAAPVDED